MFERKIEKNLEYWSNNPSKKPLVIRGARQTGKTTLVRKFSRQFDIFIELNLEKDASRRLFSETRDIRETVQSIEGLTNQRVISGRTLLFLDEIQYSMPAIKMLRYFHEEMPDLHVIAAGSLLEVRMKTEGWSFPVGRVEFLYLYPVTFEEFLAALGEDVLLKLLVTCDTPKPVPTPLHEKLLGLLAEYMLVGGMPEAVDEFTTHRNLLQVRKCHESLAMSFKEDFAKYSRSSEVEYLKLVWDRVPFEVGTRIKYSRLAGAHSRSRNVANAFDILHEAMLVERIYPTVSTSPPLAKKYKSAPKAAMLDIGLCTHALNLTKDQIKERLIDPFYAGALFEEYTGQELLALSFDNRHTLHFWTREEKGAVSELDFLIQSGPRLLPIEVKSGSHGSLRSLHQFLRRSGTQLGIRVYGGPLRIDAHSVALPDGERINYKLLSIPFYLTFRIPELSPQSS